MLWSMERVVKTEEKQKLVLEIGKKQKFQRNFLRIAVALLAIIILCFVIMYAVVRNIIMDQSVTVSMEQFRQIQEEFQEVNEQINISATQILLDDVCSEWLFSTETTGLDIIDVRKVRQQLAIFLNTNDMINSIYLYNGNLNQFISSDRFAVINADALPDQNLVHILKSYSDYYSRNLFAREVEPESLSHERTVVYTYILNYSQGKNITNAIVVDLDIEPLIVRVLGMQSMQDSQMVIIDEKGKIWAEIQSLSLVDEETVKELIADKVDKKSGYSEMRSGGEKYFISWDHSEKSGWDFLKITKWNKVFGTLNALKQWAFTLCAVVVLIVAVETILVSRSIYHLYWELEKEKREKEKLLAPARFKAGETFLDEWIHEKKYFELDQIYTGLEQCGLKITQEQQYWTLLLKLEWHDRFVETYGISDAYLIKFGFRNVFEEIFSEDFQIKGVINHDDTMVFALISKKDGEEKENKIKKKFEEFCEKVKIFVEWQFVLFGMEHTVGLEEIPEAINKLYMIKEESFFYPENSFLLYEEICRDTEESLDYLRWDAGKLIDFSNNKEENCRQFEIFADSLAAYSSKDYMNAMIWLGVTFSKKIKDSYLLQEEQQVLMNDFLTQLINSKKKTQVDQVFTEIFAQIDYLREKVSIHKGVSQKVKKIQAYIEDNYKDINITLEFFADQFKVSANYLGRIFKQEIGMSVSEYLNYIRLQKALEKLRMTDKPAREIAMDCGFTSANHFHVYFKKKMGVTPQVYRQRQEIRRGD